MQFFNKKSGWLIILIASFWQITLSQAAETIQLITQKDLPNQLGTYRHLQIELEQPYGVVHVHVATLNEHYQAKFYQQDEQRQADAKFMDQVAKNQDIQLAINGGFYTRTFKPAGLLILQGNIMRSLAQDLLLASCIATDKNYQLLLGENRDSCLRQFNAMQTGPLLIHNSIVNKNLEFLEQRVQKSSAFFLPHRRSILAKSTDGKILAIVTSSVRLVDIANILQKYATNMGVNAIARAVDLDGGSSTGMYIHFVEQPFYFPELKRVKTMVFFTG